MFDPRCSPPIGSRGIWTNFISKSKERRGLMLSDTDYMRAALRFARRGYGATSPNPMVGAILVKGGRIIGRGWHHCAGQPHAEIEAIRDSLKPGGSVRQAALYVTLEPCCTQGRTPPCTEAIISAGIGTVVIGA